MGTQHKLAKMTPKSPGLTQGSGGIPELTAQDVAAALGYASGRVPASRTGIHLVLAKYTDDNQSIHILERTAERAAWVMWYDMGLAGHISRQAIKRISKLAISEYCESGRFTGKDAEAMAKMSKVNNNDWRRNYGKIYQSLQELFRDLEDPILRMVYRFLTEK